MTKKDPVRAAPTAEKPDVLERYRHCALRHCEIVKNGRVSVPDVDRAGHVYRKKHRIILYMIGKFYAFSDGRASSANVENKEFMLELRLRRSSTLRARLLEFRKDYLLHFRKGKTVYHAIREECIALWLDYVDAHYAGRKISGIVVRRTGVAVNKRQITLDADLPIVKPTRVEVAVTIPDEQAPEKT